MGALLSLPRGRLLGPIAFCESRSTTFSHSASGCLRQARRWSVGIYLGSGGRQAARAFGQCSWHENSFLFSRRKNGITSTGSSATPQSPGLSLSSPLAIPQSLERAPIDVVILPSGGDWWFVLREIYNYILWHSKFGFQDCFFLDSYRWGHVTFSWGRAKRSNKDLIHGVNNAFCNRDSLTISLYLPFRGLD